MGMETSVWPYALPTLLWVLPCSPTPATILCPAPLPAVPWVRGHGARVHGGGKVHSCRVWHGEWPQCRECSMATWHGEQPWGELQGVCEGCGMQLHGGVQPWGVAWGVALRCGARHMGVYGTWLHGGGDMQPWGVAQGAPASCGHVVWGASLRCGAAHARKRGVRLWGWCHVAMRHGMESTFWLQPCGMGTSPEEWCRTRGGCCAQGGCTAAGHGTRSGHGGGSGRCSPSQCGTLQPCTMSCPPRPPPSTSWLQVLQGAWRSWVGVQPQSA